MKTVLASFLFAFCLAFTQASENEERLKSLTKTNSVTELLAVLMLYRQECQQNVDPVKCLDAHGYLCELKPAISLRCVNKQLLEYHSEYRYVLKSGPSVLFLSLRKPERN